MLKINSLIIQIDRFRGGRSGRVAGSFILSFGADAFVISKEA
jgi:hypothetical protein